MMHEEWVGLSWQDQVRYQDDPDPFFVVTNYGFTVILVRVKNIFIPSEWRTLDGGILSTVEGLKLGDIVNPPDSEDEYVVTNVYENTRRWVGVRFITGIQRGEITQNNLTDWNKV